MKRSLIVLFILCGTKLFALENDTLTAEKLSVHFQNTIINQFKPSFDAPYSGGNSLKTEQENKTSLTSTFYLGAKLWRGASFYVNPEIAGGSGLSEALGIAAATNGETFRIGDPAPKIYLARMFYKQLFAFSNEKIYTEGDFNQLAEYTPTKYCAVTLGKISMADFFDDNKYSHDPRTQFMSWALMDNGAWDYPANTRGYTNGIVLEYISPTHEIRYGAAMVPVTANGNILNKAVSKANSQTLEYTHRHKIGGKEGAIRVLGFFTSANMGNYNQSVLDNPFNPNIESSRKYGNTKYGYGLNAEQAISTDLGSFCRASWNDGKNETWVFTEIDRSVSAGLSLAGTKWKRKNDNIGLAYVASGISAQHRGYLKAGGKGFMLGDGKLNYSWEKLTELFYSTELVKKQIYVTGAYQFLVNPGYNKDRSGPIHVFSLRLHARI